MNFKLQRAGYPLTIILAKVAAAYSASMSVARRGDLTPLTKLVSAAAQRSINRYLNLLDRE